MSRFTVHSAKQDLESIEPHYRDAMTDSLLLSADLLDINVGGTVFRVLRSTFAFFPKTRLSRLARARNEKQALWLCDAYRISEGNSEEGIPQYFFNRNWTNFNCVLDFYRIRSLHVTSDVCPVALKEDLEFWGLNELYVDPCCALKYFPEIDACWKEFLADKKANEEENARLRDEHFDENKFGNIRRHLWSMTEHPESSLLSKVCSTSKRGYLKF